MIFFFYIFWATNLLQVFALENRIFCARRARTSWCVFITVLWWNFVDSVVRFEMFAFRKITFQLLDSLRPFSHFLMLYSLFGGSWKFKKTIFFFQKRQPFFELHNALVFFFVFFWELIIFRQKLFICLKIEVLLIILFFINLMLFFVFLGRLRQFSKRPHFQIHSELVK